MTTNIIANPNSSGSAGSAAGANAQLESAATPQPAQSYNCQSLSPEQFAEKIGVPVTWVYDHLRQRSKDRIPHVRYGKYPRIEWNCPDVIKWIERHRYRAR